MPSRLGHIILLTRLCARAFCAESQEPRLPRLIPIDGPPLVVRDLHKRYKKDSDDAVRALEAALAGTMSPQVGRG